MQNLKTFIKYRGKRIRFCDHHLIVSFFCRLLLPPALVSLFLFHFPLLKQLNWRQLSLTNLPPLSTLPINLSYELLSLGVTSCLCIFIVYLFITFKIDFFKQLQHRQKIARMIIDNNWYDSETITEDSFFKDLPSSKSKEKITYFPKIYYHMKAGYLHISVEITMGRNQDQLLKLERKLESGLYCDLVDKELQEGFIEYVLLYDTIGSRISIDEVQALDGQLKLMKNTYWEYDSLPHMLLAGGTGGGKSYFILTLIKALLETDAILYVLDPKNSDLADLSSVIPNVYFKKEDMIDCLNQFYELMMARTIEMKQMENYQTGQNYAALGLPAHFLIFDEYIAFMDMIGRESTEVMSKIKQIVMLGRQMGFFIILACQRPDAKHLGDGIRDQFMFRVTLGRMSPLGYSMMYGDIEKDFFNKRFKGRGYADSGYSVVSEFYSPFVPKKYNFLQQIGRVYQKRVNSGTPCEAEGGPSC
ncbi:TPA: ATP-binding protein [Enterococcus faecalis]|nr:ATP-binding protein [Enterococcus faecalis]EGO6562253.1 ATP-binding protein [Enterococcus faecalis]EGO7560210.1 ATP-binding protein [Enterococcus faecalis]EGO7742208.1 ATP-binding protein [Enterococcus faecalis]EGO8387380.1 ATP-binding protein [Enterococcus faecalis]